MKLYKLPIFKLALYFIPLLASNSYSTTEAHIKKLNTKKEFTLRDLIHENKGCPENSICSKENGKKILYWEQNINETNINKMTMSAEKLRKQIGIPVQFLTTKESKKSIDPILWNSRCSGHNPKDKNLTIYKAIKFFRNNPKSNQVNLVPVTLKNNFNTQYEIPYGAQALLIKDKKIFFVHEFQDVLMHMSVSTKGKWKAEIIPSKLLTKARQEKENTQCKLAHKPNKFFSTSYCLTIWNEDIKGLSTIEQSWSCP